MGIPERKEREKEHRREEILDAAQKVFFDKGLLVATMDEIAETAELSKGTLYLYYKSKEDLYLAVMMRGMQKLFELFAAVMAGADSVPRLLVKLLSAYEEYFHRYPNYFRMMHYLQSPQFHKQVSAEMKESCDAVNHRMWDAVIALIRRGMDEGHVRRDLDPTEISVILWSSATSLLLRVDAQLDMWKERMGIDLYHTLNVSNRLLLSSVLTDPGRTEIKDELTVSYQTVQT